MTQPSSTTRPDGDVLLPGKLPSWLLTEVLAGAASLPAEVRVGPCVGEDAAAIDVGEGTVVVASDPVTLAGAGIARLAVAVNANDVAVMGYMPRWFVATVLFPPGTTVRIVRQLFEELHAAVGATNVALVGGHTEVTHAVCQTVVIGTMLGHGPRSDLVRSAGAAPGDVVVQIGRAPIEGAQVLAEHLGQAVPTLDPGDSIDVAHAALAAASAGATALHDPTEGGLASGLHELAVASGVAIEVDRAAIPWHPESVRLVRSAGADPWTTLASGAVLQHSKLDPLRTRSQRCDRSATL